LQQTKSITINEAQFQVSENLHEFLKVFSSQQERKLPIWIDQICINQDDLAEKSVQIGLMRKIYSQACETLLWLGPEADDSIAFKTIQAFLVTGKPYMQTAPEGAIIRDSFYRM
jgi:hypothetical protein